jgi:hypothetical protein
MAGTGDAFFSADVNNFWLSVHWHRNGFYFLWIPFLFSFFGQDLQDI